MFRQLVGTAGSLDNINSLFIYHPLQISALIETVWLNRNNAAGSPTTAPFVPWAPEVAWPILSANFFTGYTWPTVGSPTPILPLLPSPLSFILPQDQPGLGSVAPPGLPTHSTNWDHMIYAYIIENTRIFEIFSKVLETYMYSEQLETPSPASQLFWRNVEFLILGDAAPSMLWTTTSRSRRDEVANRLTDYYWMFGADLSHAPEISTRHPYQKPAAANRDFFSTFERFGGEVWRGTVNAKNTSGANDSDAAVIATLARRLYDMMGTRRINGNLSREEFRAVAVMSFLHLAVMFDSPAVVDLKATASSPEMRLQKIAERVGMSAHPKSKPFFDLAAPFSQLMQGIETGSYNQPAGAQLLYKPVSAVSANAEYVIDQYSLATGHDLKSQAVSQVPRTAAQPMAMTRMSAPPGALANHDHAHAARALAKQ